MPLGKFAPYRNVSLRDWQQPAQHFLVVKRAIVSFCMLPVPRRVKQLNKKLLDGIQMLSLDINNDHRIKPFLLTMNGNTLVDML
jgi:hypothetical protein